MALLQRITDNKRLRGFLAQYSPSEWEACIEAVLLVGVRALEKKYTFNLKLDQLVTVAGLRPVKRNSNLKPRQENRGSLSVADKRSVKPVNSFSPTIPEFRNIQAAVSPTFVRGLKKQTHRGLPVSASTSVLQPPTQLPGSSEIMKIAEGFLRHPFAAQITSQELWTGR